MSGCSASVRWNPTCLEVRWGTEGDTMGTLQVPERPMNLG